MHNEDTARNQPPSTLSPVDLRTLGRIILQGIDRDTPLCRDSPPEALLGALLRTSMQTLDGQPHIEVRSRERVVLPSSPAAEVEIDLLLQRPGGQPVAVIEIEGWRWHRRSPEEHEKEILRDRLLRRYYSLVLRYAAAEVLRQPWTVFLDIYAHLEASSEIGATLMSAGMRLIAEACASCEGSHEMSATPDEAPSAPLSRLEHLRQVAATLPLPPPTSDAALQRLRQDYPRMYAQWEDTEVEVLRTSFCGRVDVEDVALALGRTEAAVWAQLRRMQLVDG